MSTVEPLGRRIFVVDPPTEPDKLILPEGVKGYPTTAGVVTAVGDLEYLSDVNPGDVVYYWNGQATELHDAKIIGEDALVAIERGPRNF